MPSRRTTFALCAILTIVAVSLEGTEVVYRDDFQAGGAGINPAGWVDSHVGRPSPQPQGVFRTWPDPLDPANVVYGTQASSAVTTTLTTRHFDARGRFEYRGRFLRERDDSRGGMTFFSSYPDADAFYLIGIAQQPNTAGLTMQLMAAGGATPGGKLDSGFTPEPNRWYHFLIQADAVPNATVIRARFWPVGNPEPTTFSIDARDTSNGRHTSGRIGVWSGRHGKTYVDDLDVRSPVDHIAPQIEFVDAATQAVLDPALLALFKSAPSIIVRITDDLSGVAASSVQLDGADYTGGAITIDGLHRVTATATDAVGNRSSAALDLLVDQLPPIITLLASGAPLQDGAVSSTDVMLSAAITDSTPVTSVARVDGVVVALPFGAAAERPYTFGVTAVDQVGHEATVVASFIVDKTPPAITILANGSPLAAGVYFKDDVTLTWSVIDDTLASTSATLNGSPVTSGMTVTAEQTHALVVTATDRAGHRSIVERRFNIDRTAPEVQLLANGEPLLANTFFPAAVVLTANIRDDTPTTTAAMLDGQPFILGNPVSAEGAHTITVVVTSAADLSTTVGPLSFTIDLTPPAVTLTEGGAPLVDGMKFSRDVIPVVIATDNLTLEPHRSLILNGSPYPLGAAILEERAEHTISAAARDHAGHTTTTGPFRFALDKTPPVITVTDAGTDQPIPADALYNRALLLRVTIFDVTGTTLSSTLDGTLFDLAAPITSEGPHSVVISATDELGHRSDVVVRFTIDTVPPSIIFTTPAAESLVATPLLYAEGSADDAVSMTINGRDAYIDSATASFHLQDISLLEGRNELVVTAVDKAGNMTTLTHVVHLDTHRPELVVTAPVANTCLDVEVVEVRGSVSDRAIDSVRIGLGSLGGSAASAAVLSDGSWSHLLPIPAEGNHIIIVEATDRVGHTTVATVALTIDRTAPAMDIFESGVPFTEPFVNRSVTPMVRLIESDPRTTIVMTLDDAPHVAGTPVEIEGEHTLRAVATDCAGHSSQKSVTFTIDRTAPQVLTIEPAAGSTVGRTPQIAGTVSTDTAAIVVQPGDQRFSVTGGAFTLTGVDLVDGRNDLVLRLIDRAGNTTDVAYRLTLKLTTPVVEILDDGSPIPAGALRNRTVTPTIRVTEPEAKITAMLNGSPFVSGTTISTDGAYTLTATASDDFGHTSEPVTATFTIDRTPPMVTIVAPTEGASVDIETIAITGTVSGPDVASVSVNGTPATLTGSSFSATAALDFGANLIRAIARDQAGNIGVAEIEVMRRTDRRAIVLTAPADGSVTNRATIAVSGQVFVDGAMVTVNGTAVEVDPAGVFRLPSVSLAEGENLITARVTVGSAPPNEITVRVTADRTPPFLRLLESGQALADGSRFADQATIMATATDDQMPLAVSLVVDGVAATPPVTITQSGVHRIVATARDAAGNESRLERTIHVGLPGTASGCSISDLDPQSHSIIGSSVVTITGRSHSAGVKVNGVPALVRAGSFCATVELPAEGSNEVTIACTDAGGAATGSETRLTLQRTAGEPSLTVTAPGEGSVHITGTVAVSGTVDSSVIGVEVNGVAATISGATFTVPDVRLSPGLNIVTVRARNGAGRTVALSRRVIHLKDAPSIQITSPVPGVVTGQPTIDISGVWTNVVPSTITVSGSSTVVAVAFDDGTGSFTATTSLDPGSQTITVTGRDASDRVASASIPVTLTFGAPSIAINEPLDNSHTSADSITLSGTFQAAPGSTIEVNGIPATISGNTFTSTGSAPAYVARVTEPNGLTTIDVVRVVKRSATTTVVETFPPPESFGVDPGVMPLVLFSQPVDSAVDFRLENAAGSAVSGIRRVERGVLSFAPSAVLTAGERYTIRSLDHASSFTVGGAAPSAAPQLGSIPPQLCASTLTITGTAAPSSRLRIDLGSFTFTTTAATTGTWSYDLPLTGRAGYQAVRARIVGSDGSLSRAAEACFLVDCAGSQVVGVTFDRSVNRITVQLSKEDNPAIVLRLDDGREVTSSVTVHGTTLTVTPSEELSSKSVTLFVATLPPYTQTFPYESDQPPAAGDGSGLITGEVFAAYTGRPLAGASVSIGSATILTDVRGRYAARVAEGAHTIIVSAKDHVAVHRQIVVPAGAAVVPIDIRLARDVDELDGQTLPGLLPLGWSLQSARSVGAPQSSAASPVVFTVPLADITATAQVLTAVQYREDRDEWQVLTPVVNIAADGTVQIPITEEGTYALVYADMAPHLARPPTPSSGAALRGVAAAMPAVALIAESFTLDPAVVLPGGRTLATVKISGFDPHRFPSGTAVQASIDEVLSLADGSMITDPPFATDLILYRDLAGTTGIAQFQLAPSLRASEVVLQSGADHIRIQPYPDRLDRGTLIGPEGGRVPGDGEVTIEIGPGATTEPISATAKKLTDLAQFGTIAGFTILTGFTLELNPSIPLQVPASATIAGARVSSSAQLVLAEVLDDTPYGRTFRLAALADTISGDRATTKAIDRSVLPIDGIIRSGRYLLLAATQPIAFATGYVRVSDTRVSTPTLGVADLTRPTHLFALPVPAAQFALIPRQTTTGDGATYTHPTSVMAGEVVQVGELALVAQPPTIVSTVPTNEGTNVSLGANIQITFSKDIATAEINILNSQASISATATIAGPIVTLTPAEPLKPATRYVITVSPSTRATNGAPFGRAYSFAFTTVAQILNAEVRSERIRITIPDANGHSRVTGSAGALPAGWNAVAVRRGRDFMTRFQSTAASDGTFTFLITEPVDLRDLLDLQVVNNAGALAAIIPLTPFSSEDGRSFVASSDRETRYTTPENIVVTVPAGSFDEPTVILATPAQKSELQTIPSFDAELNYSASVNLEFKGVAKERLQVSISAPENANPARNYLLGWLGQSMRGPRLMIADTLRLENGRFTTETATTSSLRTSHSSIVARPSTHTVYTGSELKSYLLGVNRSGVHAVVDINSSTGTAWAVMEGLQGSYELYWDTMESLYAPSFYVELGRVAFPVPANRQFEVVGVDAGTGLQAFAKVYDPLLADAGAGVAVASANPDTQGPYPVFGTPFRIETLDVSVSDVSIQSVRGFAVRLSGGSITVTQSDSALRVSVLNVTRGGFATGTGPLTVSGERGDRIMIAVEEKDIDPGTSLSVVFSEPLYNGGVEGEPAIDAYLRQLLTLAKASNGGTAFTDVTSLARFRLESDNRRIVIDVAAIERGATYRLTLKKTIADASGAGGTPGLGLGQAIVGVGSDATTTRAVTLELLFSTRAPAGKLGSFDLTSGVLRDYALNGNVLLVSALDGGVFAYDTAEPTGLSSPAALLGRVDPGITQFWGIASDHHGRIYTTGMTPAATSLQAYRLEHFVFGPNPAIPAPAPRTVAPIAGAQIGWAPGASLALSAGGTLLSDRAEGIPRKLQILLQDDQVTYDTLAGFRAAINATVHAVHGEFEELIATIPISGYDPDPALGRPYRRQRITVENLSLDLRWSADAVPGVPAHIPGIVARSGDRIRVLRNVATYGVVAIFGYGIGVYDLNAIESNHEPTRPTDYKPLRTQVRLTRASLDARTGSCNLPGNDTYAIPDLSFTPEAAILTNANDSTLNVFALDSMRGVLDLALKPPASTAEMTGEFDDPCERGDYGLVFRGSQIAAPGFYDHPRLAELRSLFLARTGRTPTGRFNGVSHYRWRLEAQDNKAVAPSSAQSANVSAPGQRGSKAGTTVERDYLLIPGNDYGLLIVEAGGTPPLSYAASQPLAEQHLVDIIWIPTGAFAVRHIPRTSLAAVTDRLGRVLLVDLTRIDERFDANGNLTSGLFPTAKSALGVPALDPDEVGVDDPRIVWKSAKPGPNELPLAGGTLAPLIDPETGILFAGRLLEKTTNIVSAIDPRIRMKIDTGKPGGLGEAGGVVPLGITPPPGVLVPGNANASLGAFRLEMSLPGAIAEKLPGGAVRISVESERVPGATSEQTMVPFPRAHLREKRRDGSTESRPASFLMQRAIPAALAAQLRHQRGFNKFFSPWVVTIGDPRASQQYLGSSQAKKDAGCLSCDRPLHLQGKGEADGVFELWSGGSMLVVRPEVDLFNETPYAFLGAGDRLAARFGSIRGRKARDEPIKVAGQNPPVAIGMLQDTTYIHSGEIEVAALDLDAGGRAGWNAAVARVYRSRVLGTTAFGEAWDSPMLRFLVPMPDGSMVEYHDGAGEIWRMELSPFEPGVFKAKGLFHRLVRTNAGWSLIDQQWRITRFDGLGRLVSESDEFTPADEAAAGNTIRYLYDSQGRLARIVDPVGRETRITYYQEPSPAAGRIHEVRTDWRGWVVSYEYDSQGRLTDVRLPHVDNPFVTAGAFTGRPHIEYRYAPITPPPSASTGSQQYTDYADLVGNLISVREPAEVVSGSAPRVTFSYGPPSQSLERDRVRTQTWGSGESASFTYPVPDRTSSTDALGQVREYEFSAPQSHDGRLHIARLTEKAVPVAPVATPLPDFAPITLAPIGTDLHTAFEYQGDGLVLRVTHANGRVDEHEWAPAANGTAGSILRKSTTSGPGLSVTETHYRRDLATSNSRNSLVEIGMKDDVTSDASGGPIFREAPQPSRERLNTTRSDDEVREDFEWNPLGQFVRTRKTDTDGRVSFQSETHHHRVDSPNLLERSRPSSFLAGSDDIRTDREYARSGTGEIITTKDVKRGTTTVEYRDARGAVIRRLVSEAGNTLSDEKFGYDASGRLAVIERAQRNVGVVRQTFTWDSVGRTLRSTLDQARVGASSTTIITETEYDLPAKQIISYDPFASTREARTITRLDALGRVIETERVSSSTPQTIRRATAYDINGIAAFSSDGTRQSSLHYFDVLGRERSFVLSNGTSGQKDWNAWGEVLAARTFGPNSALLASTRNILTIKGRLRAANEQIDLAGRTSQTRMTWDGDRTTTVRVGEVPMMAANNLAATGVYRTSQTVRDLAGRTEDERSGEAIGFAGLIDNNLATWSKRTATYRGDLPDVVLDFEPRVGATYETRTTHDGLHRPVHVNEPGGYSTSFDYDENGNATSIERPGMKPEMTLVDSRSLPLAVTLPDGTTRGMEYDERGLLRKRIDEGGEATSYATDGLGRLTRVDYPDGTFEETRYENGTGSVLARRDRAGKWISVAYDPRGRVASLHDGDDPGTAPVLMAYDYHPDGRLQRVRNAQAAIEYDQYDLLGRPGITRSIRYPETAGGAPEAYTQGHVWSIHQGERSSWTMPATGTSVPADDPGSPWLQTIVEMRDAGGNLIRQESGNVTLSESHGRSPGRLSWRKQTTGLATVSTEFGFDDGLSTPSDVELPSSTNSSSGQRSGLPLWSRTSVNSQQRAGSGIARDAARRLSASTDLGLLDRLSAWSYDAKGRLEQSWLQLRSKTPSSTPASAREGLTPPDFRHARTTTSQFTSAQASLLGETILRIEPPSWTATETPGHQIGTMTTHLGGSQQIERDYAFTGGRRTQDGDWTYTFDTLGRMRSAESRIAGRRIEYSWDPNNRLVGRTAYEPDSSGWKIEARASVLSRDALPAEATFVWDPIADRLVAVFSRGGGVVRQYLHGDQAYDDPIEVRVAAVPGGTPIRYFPVIDHAGTGSLQAVLDVSGNLVERVLYGDSYGDAPRYLQGPVVDRIEMSARKDANGDVERITITAHLSETIVASTIHHGAMLRSVKSDRTAAHTLAVDPLLVDKSTLIWSLSPDDWTALSTASGAEALEVSITNVLRAEGWGAASVTPIPDWAKLVYSGVDATPSAPVIFREQLSTTHTWLSTITTEAPRPLYELPSLYTAAGEDSRAKVMFGFQALPFVEPATGLVYARARWLDPRTGAFLSPDPMGYRDSSNLYAFCASDPVNCRDATGLIGIFLDGTWDHEIQTRHRVPSNVRRLFDAYTGGEARYFRGVGNDRDNNLLMQGFGGLFGLGGSNIVRQALVRVKAAYAAGDRVVDIVGYSRGAALALDLAGEIEKSSDLPGMQLRFIGLFDAVGSFGESGNSVNIGYDLRSPTSATLRVHVIARDEARRHFELLRPSGFIEARVPGGHSNIGGTYPNRALGNRALWFMLDETNSRLGALFDASLIDWGLGDTARPENVTTTYEACTWSSVPISPCQRSSREAFETSLRWGTTVAEPPQRQRPSAAYPF